MRKASAATLLLGSLLLVGLAAVGSMPRAAAAVLIALDLPALVSQSDHIVVAHAETQTSRYAEGLILTDVRLRVISTLKGPAAVGSTLIATHLGGAVDRVGLRVPGAAQFSLGRSAIVFLRRAQGSDDLNVTGMSQGLLPILGTGSDAQVQLGGDQATLMQRDAQGALVPMPSAARRQSLSSVLADIARLTAR
jgi:hypothetical protein